MNSNSQVQIKTYASTGFYIVELSRPVEDAPDIVEIIKLLRLPKFGDWELSETQQILEHAHRIFDNFMHSKKPEVLEFPYPYNHRLVWTLDEGAFSIRGRTYYDRKDLY